MNKAWVLFHILASRRVVLLDLHCVKSVRIQSFSGPYFTVFSSNARKYGPEKLEMRTLFAQCLYRKQDLPSFIWRFWRIAARGGSPNLVVSCNGKNVDAEEAQSSILNVTVEWQFSLQFAPWHGDFSRNLCKMSKNYLKRIYDDLAQITRKCKPCCWNLRRLLTIDL